MLGRLDSLVGAKGKHRWTWPLGPWSLPYTMRLPKDGLQGWSCPRLDIWVSPNQMGHGKTQNGSGIGYPSVIPSHSLTVLWTSCWGTTLELQALVTFSLCGLDGLGTSGLASCVLPRGSPVHPTPRSPHPSQSCSEPPGAEVGCGVGGDWNHGVLRPVSPTSLLPLDSTK